MKYIYNYIIILVLALTVSACNYLDVVPDDIATIDHAFSNRYNAEKYLSTIYQQGPRYGDATSNPAFMGTGEFIVNDRIRPDWMGMQVALGYSTPTDPYANYWSGGAAYTPSLYKNINDCNTFLKNIESVPDLDSQEKARWSAEVKLHKAMDIFFLMEMYGPVVLLKENPPVGASGETIRAYREKIDDCFEYILQLTEEALGDSEDNKPLPDVITTTSTELGRYTHPIASMFKARVLTAWASPLYNGNTDFNNFLNHEGKPFFNQTPDPSRWEKAAAACKKAIEACETAGIRLYQQSDYKTPVGLPEQVNLLNTLRSVYTERWNVELIWGCSSTTIYQGCAMPRYAASSSQATRGIYCVPLDIVDEFYSKNGVPINEDKTYDYQGRFSIRKGDSQHKYYIDQTEQTVSMNFDREPRFYSWLTFDRAVWYGNTPQTNFTVKMRWGEPASSSLQPRDLHVTGYWPKKYVNFESQFRNADTWYEYKYPVPMMRLADLYLLYAETLNEVKSSPDQEIYQYVDMVRRRAGLEGVLDSWRKYSNEPDKPLTKAGMREIIHRERKIELFAESSYFWDCRRWKTAVKDLNNRKIEGFNTSATDIREYYTVVPYYTQSFTVNNYLLPIPDSDIINNPNLIQNPGW